MAFRILQLWKASAMMLEAPKEWRRFYNSNSKAVDLKTLKPMIMEKIQNLANGYPAKDTAVLAQEVLKARGLLYRGVSDLLRHLPVWTCKYCPEVYVGESGHLIRTCGGNRRRHSKIKAHEWIKACLNDILVPVESYHVQNTVHNVTNPEERFGHDRIPAVVELCLHAGATPSDQSAYADNMESRTGFKLAEAPSDKEMKLVAIETLKAWEALRDGVQKLLVVFPVKVCKLCSEVHVGHSGNKARICRIPESWQEAHLWKKAGVDDLVPAKRVWYRRPQDPPVLVDEGRDYYGHAPAVIDMCVKAGAIAPSKYFSIMKADGFSAPI